MIKVYLAKKISRRVVEGHPWIFSNEVDRVEGEVVGGETVTVFTHDNKFIGSWIYKP
jgi:23S rRNA (cytosine1962-C5)-methyltransferase